MWFDPNFAKNNVRMKSLIYILLIAGLTACQFDGGQRVNDDYAYWSSVNSNGSWTSAAEAAVRATTLPFSRPKDIESYCSRYLYLDSESRVKFWVGLLSVMAEFESDLNPQTRYTETLRDSQNQRVVSRGLLQISIESANQQRYSCKIRAAEDLHDPAINIGCGTKILSSWVARDGVVASSGGEHRGGARYWSVLRSTNSAATKIRNQTNQLQFCRS